MGTHKSIAISLIKSPYKEYDSIKDALNDGESKYHVFRTVGDYNLVAIKTNDNMSTVANVLNEFERPSINCSIDSIHTFYALARENFDYDYFFDFKSRFLFLTFITLNYAEIIKSKKPIKEVILEIENIIGLNQKEYVIYDSLDSFDLLLLFKKDIYADGTDIIKKIDNIEFVVYSYSMFSYSDKIFEDSQYTETADKITICSVINKNTSFKEWLIEFEKKYLIIDTSSISEENNLTYTDIFQKHFRYNRLGNEDIIINIRCLEIKKFLSEFKDNDGVFCNDSFKNAFSSCRIHIDNYFGSANDIKNGSNHHVISKLKSEFEKVKNEHDNIIRNDIKTAFLEILNSCDNLFKNNFAIDVYTCILDVYDVFLQRLKSFDYCDNEKLPDYNDSINKVRHSIMSIVSGALHADHQFFQSQGFNAVQFNIPSKLLVFYMDYVSKLTKVLKDNDEPIFKFIITPNLYLDTSCIKLFSDSSYDSLVKMRTSVDSLFKPEIFIQNITHEAAHFVGKKSRLRKKRIYYSIKILSICYSTYLLQNIKDNVKAYSLLDSLYLKLFSNAEKYKEKGFDIFLFETVCNVVKAIMFNRFEAKKHETGSGNNEKFFYLHEIRFTLEEIIRDMSDDNETIKRIMNEFKCNNQHNDNSEVLAEVYVKHYLYDTFRNNLRVAQSGSKKQLDSLVKIMKESYADLVMTKALNISAKEYLTGVISQKLDKELDEEKFADYLKKDMKIERYLTVCWAHDWKIDGIRFDDSPKNRRMEIIRKYDENNRRYKMDTERKCMEYYVKYLKECLLQLNEIDFTSVSDIFSIITTGDFFNGVKMINENIENYKKDILNNKNALL